MLIQKSSIRQFLVFVFSSNSGSYNTLVNVGARLSESSTEYEVDIIIPNWNGQEWLGGCLDSLLNQTFQAFRIIVVDNGSTDGSAEFVSTSYPRVHLITLAENTGFSGGINAGIRAGTAPYVCWFNNDAEASPAFLENLLTTLKAREAEGFGMAAAKVFFKGSPNIINSAGSFVGLDGIGRDRGFKQPDGSVFNQMTEIFGPAGVAALYCRTLFEKVGLLDEDFFLYSEEVDLNYRAQLAGYRCLYVPEAKVWHRGSATSHRINRRIVYLANRNGLLAIIKNLPAVLFLWLLPWIFLGQLYQLMLFARQGNFIPALQGKLAVIPLLPATLTKRKVIQRQRKVTIVQFKRQMALGRTTPFLLQFIIKRFGFIRLGSLL